MIVLVDIGNTRTKYLIEHADGRIERNLVDNNDISKSWLMAHWNKARQVYIASVKSGTITDTISDWATGNNINISFTESEKNRYGVTNSYQKPETLGVDRWLTLIGAATLYPRSSAIIIDAGTATTIDVLDENGTHQGGWILSGIDLLLSQLNQNTAKVKFEVSETSNLSFGRSTSECVNNAAWAATVAMINLGIKEAENNYQVKHCILLGGNADKLLPFIESKSAKVNILPDLIFEGLKRYSL